MRVAGERGLSPFFLGAEKGKGAACKFGQFKVGKHAGRKTCVARDMIMSF